MGMERVGDHPFELTQIQLGGKILRDSKVGAQCPDI